MNVEIGTEAAQFPEKEYINGIFLAVCGFGTKRQYNLAMWILVFPFPLHAVNSPHTYVSSKDFCRKIC
jgi:hypothetical protein